MPIDGRAQRQGAATSAAAHARRVSRAGAARLLRVRAGLHGRLRTEELPDRTVAEPDRKGLWLQQLHSRQLPCENQLRYQRRAHRQTGIRRARSEEHTSELQSLMRISYDVFCWKQTKQKRDKYRTT